MAELTNQSPQETDTTELQNQDNTEFERLYEMTPTVVYAGMTEVFMGRRREVVGTRLGRAVMRRSAMPRLVRTGK